MTQDNKFSGVRKKYDNFDYIDEKYSGGLKIEGFGEFEYRAAWLNNLSHFEHDNILQLIAKIWGFDFFVFKHIPVFKTMFLLHLIITWLIVRWYLISPTPTPELNTLEKFTARIAGFEKNSIYNITLVTDNEGNIYSYRVGPREKLEVTPQNELHSDK